MTLSGLIVVLELTRWMRTGDFSLIGGLRERKSMRVAFCTVKHAVFGGTLINAGGIVIFSS